VENAAARCLCAQGFVARPSGACEAVTGANCPQHPGDSAEPDDCMTAAKPIKTTDQPRSQTIDPVGDYDFVQLTAENNFVYNVTVKAAGSPVLPRIDAFDQGGVWLSGVDGPGTAVLSFKAHYAGPHFLRVSHSPLDPSVATGAYTLSVQSVGAEDHGDGPADATPISAAFAGSTTPPDSIGGRFEVPQDQDWFQFTGASGTTYNLAFDSQRLIPSVALYNGNDTTKPVWTTEQEVIPFNLPSSGTYYLQLFPPQTQASTTAYSFQFTQQ
ncbi:MAG: PPC domain-containing protein, partial [Myxococcaceae bacterium]